MHRDQRLGLALGILLLGIVAAFFFRNENQSTELPPELIDPDRIDEQIAGNDVAPYLTGLEDRGAATGDAVRAEPTGSETDRYGLPEFLSTEQESAAFPGAGGPPNPIRRDTASPGSMPVPRENDAWEPVTERSTPNDAEQQQPPATRSMGDYVIHQVKRGETLSGIAQRYFGSSLKFTDIYEANRDLLKNPDDLRLGMKLRIPRNGRRRPASGRRAARTKAKPASARNMVRPQSPQAADPSEKRAAPASRPVKRFVPVPRSGVIRRADRPQTRRAAVPLEATPRQLTQRPPSGRRSTEERARRSMQ